MNFLLFHNARQHHLAKEIREKLEEQHCFPPLSLDNVPSNYLLFRLLVGLQIEENIHQ